MPFVLPSRNRILAPTLTNSGVLINLKYKIQFENWKLGVINLNITLLWSLLFIPSTGLMPSITAVCLMLPMWTVVLKPLTISVGWKRTQTVAWKY